MWQHGHYLRLLQERMLKKASDAGWHPTFLEAIFQSSGFSAGQPSSCPLIHPHPLRAVQRTDLPTRTSAHRSRQAGRVDAALGRIMKNHRICQVSTNWHLCVSGLSTWSCLQVSFTKGSVHFFGTSLRSWKAPDDLVTP